MVIGSYDKSVDGVTENVNNNEKYEKLRGAVFLTGIAGIFLLCGFGIALSAVKKSSPKSFSKSSTTNEQHYNSTGTDLAFQALKWGTFYSTTGCSILVYSIWKISGATTLEEFQQKARNVLPSISKKTSS